ncbi:hypothetical protein EVAR_48261_1 [Eumeta japonica]|uniref:Uncharacterized protein n=1 Tax=Eumeta variegata TaxID=151549 RepID=A0A4C1Y5V0_EUMVA|nr:hypothetical protein EVAR_48261_1 [Eumeta japonica]
MTERDKSRYTEGSVNIGGSVANRPTVDAHPFTISQRDDCRLTYAGRKLPTTVITDVTTAAGPSTGQ